MQLQNELYLKDQWKKIERQIKYLYINPNHIFKDTVIDDWLNNAAYHCKCNYFGRPTEEEEDVHETTLDQKKWYNLLLKDFNFREWKEICEAEYYPHSLVYFNSEFNIDNINKFLPELNEIIRACRILYDDDNLLENLYNYINEHFNITTTYFLMTEKQKKEYDLLRYNKPLLRYCLNKN